MISKVDMFDPILEISEDFIPIWDKFVEEWKADEERPLYLALADLARYISKLISESRTTELEDIFTVIERWLHEGDTYVKEAAVVGLLEDLQNTNIVGIGVPEQIETYLQPESKKYWLKLYEFWENGKIINE